jgi:arylsulfatase A-like enzyme
MPPTGEWTDRIAEHIMDHPPTDAWVAELPDRVVQRARAGYYGLITHLDHQLQRVMRAIPENTVILFTADHGEMLGDHYHWRKTYAYEGSARVPFIVNHPAMDPTPSIDCPVGLEDVAPTLLEATNIAIPSSMDGQSVLSLLDGDPAWRNRYHGEHGPIYDPTNACQFLVDERWKYIWNPITDEDLLFDLQEDPQETRSLAEDPDYDAKREQFRSSLVETLRDRPEGFVHEGRLCAVDPEAWDVWEGAI